MLRNKSVEFFKSEAAKADTQYERMIRRLLDAHVESHANEQSSARVRSRAKPARVA